VNLLKEAGCKEGSRGPRQYSHICCRGCRNRPEVFDLYFAIYDKPEMKTAWETANSEDEEAHGGGGEGRRRSPRRGPNAPQTRDEIFNAIRAMNNNDFGWMVQQVGIESARRMP
jgi:hypothetical protein